MEADELQTKPPNEAHLHTSVSETTSPTTVKSTEEKDSNVAVNREQEISANNKAGDEVSEGHSKVLSPLAETTVFPKDEPGTVREPSETHDKYAEHITYSESGEAIYTDPDTKYQYKWDTTKNEWAPVGSAANKETNPYENEHYRWCTETNQWIPKVATDNNKETEFYRWDEERKEWIPKMQSSDATYSYEDGVHTYMDKDGTVYFWDTEKSAWFPKIDDDFMARYQLSYGFIDNTSQDSKTSQTSQTSQVETKTQTEDNKSGSNPTATTGSKRKAAEPAKWFDLPPEHNTKVYVSNLPLDITLEEFVQVMSKCGLIMKDPKSSKYKVKLYAENDGQLKGDGLCDYIKIESVDLALNLLDGYDVRGHKIKVQRAKFEMRGEYNPALKPKKKKKDKEKIQKMKERLFDWRPEKMRGERSKHERIVILKNLFDPERLRKDLKLTMDFQITLREECSKCGSVRRVTIHDHHPDGVAEITMSSPEEADLVVQMMNNRYLKDEKRQVKAEIWDGKIKYRKEETEAERDARLAQWQKFLETHDDDDEENSKKITAEPKAAES